MRLSRNEEVNMKYKEGGHMPTFLDISESIKSKVEAALFHPSAIESSLDSNKTGINSLLRRRNEQN
jgi:hypothetical protein